VIVVDTNVIAYLVIDGREDARRVLERDRAWVAPRLWRSEFRNVLASLLRAGRIELDQAIRFAEIAEDLMAGGEHEVPSLRVLALANRSGCSAYDCEFVALSEDLGVPLVTRDKAVLRAFPGVAAKPEHYLSGSSG